MVDHFDIFNSLNLYFIYSRASSVERHIFHVSDCNTTFSSLFHCKYSLVKIPFFSQHFNMHLSVALDLFIF